VFSYLYFGIFLTLGLSCLYKMRDNCTFVPHRAAEVNYIKRYEVHGQSSKGGGLYIESKWLTQEGNDSRKYLAELRHGRGTDTVLIQLAALLCVTS